MNATRLLPVVLCIDVEPDGWFIDRRRPEPWTGFDHSLAFFNEMRDRLARASGAPVRYTWFVRADPQIAETYGRPDWAFDRYREALRDLERRGDEIGVHTHAYHWDDARGDWILDHGNQAWVERSVRMSCDAFAEHFGRPSRTFRFGDRWVNGETIQLLESLGIEFDLTVEPGYGAMPTYHPGHGYTGSLPDYDGVPRVPYVPASEDFRRPSARRHDGLRIVPITTAPIRPSWLRRLRARWRGLSLQPRATALISHTPATFQRVVRHALDRDLDGHLAFVVRTGAVGESRLAARIRANLNWLTRQDRAGAMRWVNPGEAMAILRPQSGSAAPAAASSRT